MSAWEALQATPPEDRVYIPEASQLPFDFGTAVRLLGANHPEFDNPFHERCETCEFLVKFTGRQ